MAEYQHTHNGSSYRLVQTPMNWIDAQVSAVAWPIVLVILQSRRLIQGISQFSTSITDTKQEDLSY